VSGSLALSLQPLLSKFCRAGLTSHRVARFAPNWLSRVPSGMGDRKARCCRSYEFPEDIANDRGNPPAWQDPKHW
jgi:hypothetical protein